MSIEIQSVTKKFSNFTVLNDINLVVESGELIALLGPSGSGKTTLLRIIAGLEHPDSGSIRLQGEEAQSKHVAQRGVGFVFQHYALFKHMTVFENVAFGLRVRPFHQRPSRDRIQKRVMELLDILHLSHFHDRYPGQLSGGQRQRVALARALAVDPKVLLLDEPFGALDAKVRLELRRWLRRLHDTLAVTTIFVTHDQEEAMEVADRVVVMSTGQIEQVGTPDEVYHKPINSFVYDFLGHYNEFEGWLDKDGVAHLVEYQLAEPRISAMTAPTSCLGRHPKLRKWLKRLFGDFIAPPASLPASTPAYEAIRSDGPEIKLFTRPHEMLISKAKDTEQKYLSAFITHINPAGAMVKIELERINGSPIEVEMTKEMMDELKLERSQQVYVYPRTMRVFG